MIIKKKGFPEEGEFVICTVTRILPYGAFVSLEEYDKDGFIPIGEIASIWVRNIRDYIKENQKAVAKVLSIDRRKGHIDLSIRRVNDFQRKKKLEEWKRLQKAFKLLELAGRKIGKSVDELYYGLGVKFEEKFGELYAGFEEAVRGNREAVELIPEEFREEVISIARENVTIPKVKISGFLELKSYAWNGVEIVKEALKKAKQAASEEKAENEASVEILYMSPPRYKLSVIADNYKIAEKILKKAYENAINYIIREKGEARFIREERK